MGGSTRVCSINRQEAIDKSPRKKKTAIFVRSQAFVMPRHCSAVGCKSRDTKDIRKSGITFHRLPKKGNPRRTTWIINSRRKGPEGKGQWDPQSGFIYFCSKHFTPDSFELSGVSGYRRLKDDAIPTIFENQPRERGNAGKCATKQRGRPRSVDKHISVKTSTINEDSENQEISNNEAVVQKVAENECENGEGEDKHVQPPPQPSSEAPQTSEETSLEDPPPDPSSPQPPPRPPSPSCYMRRLPPPPGFYLPKEHNYAQLCPLVWRKRYDKAIDSLEKALRLLSAARRRENRLRHALLRLRENRLRSTLFRTREGAKGKEARGGRFSSWTSQKGQGAKVERGCRDLEGLEESANEGATDEIDLLAEGWNGQTQAKGKVTGEEEEGCCFYCGRDNEGNKVSGYKEATVGADEVQGSHTKYKPKRIQEIKKKAKVLKEQKSENSRTDAAPVEQQSYYLYYCESAENEDTMQVVTMELQPHQLNTEDETSLELHNNAEAVQQLALLHPQTDMHTSSGPIQYQTTLQETSAPFQLQQIQVLQPQQGLLLPDLATKEKSDVEMEQGQQFFWVQERTDDHVLLMSVPTEARERNRVDVETVIETVQPQVILERYQSKDAEERDGLSVKCDSTALTVTGWENGQITHQSDMRPTADVRERLKEHLEGFQLQLSSEFID
ncbi:THAP domain-containing protein 7 [Labeo rohita]|uniref:THAP domain-containing protein 7 n=2 Tax=Labeo rohita TaxID=84645 RepID=A0ABQ8LRK0_LABRO|nr:THAP domain-containing protein 7 [Labeo rohita]